MYLVGNSVNIHFTMEDPKIAKRDYRFQAITTLEIIARGAMVRQVWGKKQILWDGSIFSVISVRV